MKSFSLLLALPGALAIDNGLGLTPPMGWRSWNLYGGNVNQQLLQGIMDGMISKKRTVDGKPTSLCDLGYCDVGLDDNWQVCSDNKNYHYHDDAGIPVINRDRFPDMIAMTDYAHKRGLTAGWYMNNCICKETANATDAMYQSDVAALTEFGFDGLKLDGCGTQLDLDRWAQLLNATGRPVMIENCHWGRTVPTENWCPWNFFRSSTDILATYGSVVSNLQSTIQWAETGLSKPGCWAYPDMLEVGCAHDGGGLNKFETQTHFSAWAIVSSPLTLSHDVNNDTIMDAIWPVISNKELIAVNQEWAGHSGSPFKNADTNVTFQGRKQTFEVPSWQFFYKPLNNKRFAVLLINHDAKAQDLTLNFADIPGNSCTKCQVRCLLGHKDLGSFDATIVAKAVESHDSRFFVVSPSAEESLVV